MFSKDFFVIYEIKKPNVWLLILHCIVIFSINLNTIWMGFKPAWIEFYTYTEKSDSVWFGRLKSSRSRGTFQIYYQNTTNEL